MQPTGKTWQETAYTQDYDVARIMMCADMTEMTMEELMVRFEEEARRLGLSPQEMVTLEKAEELLNQKVSPWFEALLTYLAHKDYLVVSRKYCAPSKSSWFPGGGCPNSPGKVTRAILTAHHRLLRC